MPEGTRTLLACPGFPQLYISLSPKSCSSLVPQTDLGQSNQVPLSHGLFAIGDASLNKAIKDGILKNAEYADYEWFSILGIYGKLKVNVYGPEKQEEDR